MMHKKGYGQFCPVAKATEVIAERWTPLVLRELLMGSYRFNELRRGVPLMSPSLLSKRLKELEWAGLVERHDIPEEADIQGYFLTEAGQALHPIIMSLGEWGHRFVRSNFDDQDLDPSLLLWDIRRTLKPEHIPAKHAVILFEFPEQPANKRRWWLIKESDEREIDLCVQDPGHEVDLTITTDLQTMTRVWLGDLDLTAAIRSSQIKLQGPTALRLSIYDWIGLSPFATVEKYAPA